MSNVLLFLEIERLKNKIDRRMNMPIWPKFFTLLADPDGSINLPISELQDFLVTVAEMSRTDRTTENAALISQHVSAESTAPVDQAAFRPRPRNVLNIFSKQDEKKTTDSYHMASFRKNCQKILKHYTLTSTISTDFKVGDLVSCMVYLSKVPKYKPLYLMLENSMIEDFECVPNYSSDQMINLVDLLKNLLDLPSTILDFTNIKLLKSTLNKTMQYPVSRFPRIILMSDTSLVKDKQCTLEELILERGQEISKLEPQQYIHSTEGTKIPYCDDEEFINDLLKIVDKFDVHRMFYNAANSIFYTTMENYAVANCKFDVCDYNNIFKVMDTIRDYERCLLPKSDSLNVYLGDAMSSNVKRKKYL
jgi:Baculovirus protein of unknown function (DUF844)